MSDLIGLVALALLLGAIGYITSLVLNMYREARLDEMRFQLEQSAFGAQIDAIRAQVAREKSVKELTWNGFRKFTVAKKEFEGGDICSFYLMPHDQRPLPEFHPGQYLTFKLNIPGQNKPVIRCYSLSDGPRTDYYRVSIKRVPAPRNEPDLPPGLSSNFFHDQVNEGDILDVKAPSGQFFLDTDRAFPVVLIGGGIGITPVLSMLNQIVSSGVKREVWFFYGVRNGDEHVMADHLKQVAEAHDNIKMFICYSDPREGQDQKDVHYTHGERVSIDLFKQVLPSNNFQYYFCGPPPMMNSLFEGLKDWGAPEDAIHYEAFGPATVKKKAQADAADKAESPTLSVEFAKSGKVVSWQTAEQSLLELAEANDVALDFGCRAGNCGSCLVAIKQGDVDYLSEPGDKPEQGSCLACVCVPKSNLVLDA